MNREKKNTYAMCTHDFPDIHARSPWACGPQAWGACIRQTILAHGIYNY